MKSINCAYEFTPEDIKLLKDHTSYSTTREGLEEFVHEATTQKLEEIAEVAAEDCP